MRRVDTVVHPTGPTEIRVVGPGDGIRAFDAIASDLSSQPPATGIRADEVALRVAYDSSRETKVLSVGVEDAPLAVFKRHVVHEDVDAVCTHDRVPH
jgi:hypothetical protein